MNLPKYKTDERTGIKYELIGDYYFIAGDGEEPEDKRPIGRWGENARRLSQEKQKACVRFNAYERQTTFIPCRHRRASS